MYEEKDKKCNKCEKEMTSFDYDWNKGVCDRCKAKSFFTCGLLVGIICLLIAVPIGFVEYKYELGKCVNLKVSETDYGFTHNIEFDADYNDRCYHLRNHPLVLVEYILLYPLIISIFVGLWGGLIKMFVNMARS